MSLYRAEPPKPGNRHAPRVYVAHLTQPCGYVVTAVIIESYAYLAQNKAEIIATNCGAVLTDIKQRSDDEGKCK